MAAVVDDAAVRRYLGDLGLTTPTDWERDGFDGDTRALRRTAATLDNHRNIRILARVLLRIGRFWGFHHPDTHERTSVVAIQMIRLDHLADAVTGVPRVRRTRLLHDTVRDAIRSCERAGRRWFYAVLCWCWNTQPAENRPPHPDYTDTGHVTLLVFDTLRREYDLWDPNGGSWSVYNDVTRRMEPFSPYAAVRDSAARTNPAKRLIPGYTFLARNAMRRDTVQNSVDRMCPRQAAGVTVKTEEGSPAESPLPPAGMCASSVVLMLACCLRFNHGAPTDFDESVNRHIAGLYGFPRREFAIQLAHWHRRMYSVRSWEQMEGALGLRRTAAAAAAPRRCGAVIDDPSGNAGVACPLRPCDTGVLCEMHRERWFGWWHLPAVGEVREEVPRGLRCEDRVRWDRTMGPYPVNRGGEGQAIDVELDVHIRSIEDGIRDLEHLAALRRTADEIRSLRGVDGERYAPVMRDDGDHRPLPDARTGPTRDTQGDRIRKIGEWVRRQNEATAANDRKRPLEIGAPPPPPLRRRT